MKDDHGDPAELHRLLRPLHAVAEDGLGGQVRRLPGRPARARRAPSFEQREYNAEVNRLREAFVEADAVVRAAERGEDDLVDLVLRGIATEIGSLRYDRRRLPPAHPDHGVVTGRILAALVKAADIVLVREKLRHGQMDVRGPQFTKLVEAFVAQMKEAAEQTLPEPEMFMSVFLAKLNGWESKAEDILRGAGST